MRLKGAEHSEIICQVYLDILPNDCIYEIFSRLDIQNTVQICSITNQFNNIGKLEKTWESKIHTKYKTVFNTKSSKEACKKYYLLHVVKEKLNIKWMM